VSAEGDALPRVGEVGEERDLQWPEKLMDSGVNRDGSKREAVSVIHEGKDGSTHSEDPCSMGR